MGNDELFSRSEEPLQRGENSFKQPHHWRTKNGTGEMLNILNTSGLTPKARRDPDYRVCQDINNMITISEKEANINRVLFIPNSYTVQTIKGGRKVAKSITIVPSLF